MMITDVVGEIKKYSGCGWNDRKSGLLPDSFGYVSKRGEKPKEMEATGLGAWISAQKRWEMWIIIRRDMNVTLKNGRIFVMEPDPDTEILYQNTNKLRNYYEAFYGVI